MRPRLYVHGVIRPILVSSIVFVFALPLGAQGGVAFSGGVGASTAQLTRDDVSDAALSGVRVHFNGGMTFGRVGVEVGYSQGTLSSGSGGVPDEDLVEGDVVLAVQPASWVSFRAGQRIRAFVTAAGTERWSRTEVRVRAGGEVVPGRVKAFAEGWTALGSTVNIGTGSAGAQGGEVGLSMDIPSTAFSVRLSYSVDRAKLNDGRTELTEAVTVGIRLGRSIF